jgi:hypothetical protein
LDGSIFADDRLNRLRHGSELAGHERRILYHRRGRSPFGYA